MGGKSFLLKTCSIFVFDHSALVSTGQKLFDILKGLLGFGSGDATTSPAPRHNRCWTRSRRMSTAVRISSTGSTSSPGPRTLPACRASSATRSPWRIGGGGAIPLLVATAKGVKDLIEKFVAVPEGFSVAFEALPLDPPHLRDVLPTPSSTKPVAYGPHLAMVIGPDGINTAQRDIFTDALGRVPIRFPWDPGPDNPNDPSGWTRF